MLLSVKRFIRKTAVRLGIKQYLRPVYELYCARKAKALLGLYDPENTAYGLNTEKRGFDITVSFTTYPARINSAVYVADALLRQTLKPDRVILALAEDEYASKTALPEAYKNLEKRGLTVVFTENLKPHKKYYYAMRHYPDSIIITVDDDVFYPEDLTETLFGSYKKHPGAVSAMRAHRITFSGKEPRPYNDWEYESVYTDKPAFDLIATGIGGVLYPPGCMAARRDILLDAGLIKSTALYADDIWLKLNEIMCGVPVTLARLKGRAPVAVPDTQKTSLQSVNVDENRNDRIMADTMKLFGIDGGYLYQKLTADSGKGT